MAWNALWGMVWEDGNNFLGEKVVWNEIMAIFAAVFKGMIP